MIDDYATILTFRFSSLTVDKPFAMSICVVIERPIGDVAFISIEYLATTAVESAGIALRADTCRKNHQHPKSHRSGASTHIYASCPTRKCAQMSPITDKAKCLAISL